MTIPEQLEEFDEWLTLKYREVVREWHAVSAGYNPYLQAEYDALLKSVCREISWLQGELGGRFK